MSKVREQLPTYDADADAPAPGEGDLKPFVVFTQIKKDGPFIYAGWLDAADEAMALDFAIQHYGRDQACTEIWIAPRDRVGGLRENVQAAAQPVESPREYQIFTQANAGDQHVSSLTVRASSAAEAIRLAPERVDNASDLHNIWAIPIDAIDTTNEASIIWKNLDQTYRLARGYSKHVRAKWEKIRAQKDLAQYEKDDLEETF